MLTVKFLSRPAAIRLQYAIAVLLWSFFIGPTPGWAETRLGELPVKEITVFKDGHAFVMHEGNAAVDESGDVKLDYLPRPVIGTFWPFANDKAAQLESVSAGQQRVSFDRTALTPAELIAANAGRKIIVHENDKSWPATIVGIPERGSEELDAYAVPGTGSQLSQKGEYVQLKTDDGIMLVHMNRLQSVTFVEEPVTKVAQEEFRNLLTLHLNWRGQPGKQAHVGMVYLQKGIRWIPHYRLTLNDDGTVLVELQATLINEMTDLENVTTHLVVGVPSFDFKETLDPIALTQTMANLSVYFQTDNSTIASNFSNSIMLQTQVPRGREVRQASPQQPGVDVGPGIAEGQEDDLFVFTVNGISLRKGERMVLPVGQWTMKFEDLYQLKVPFAPPQEVRQSVGSEQQAEIARLLHAPKVKHVVRIKNDSEVPLTTAPTLFVKDGRLVAQGMMTYTSRGSSVDLELTTAVNVPVAIEDEETGRTADAMRFGSHHLSRIDSKGTISLTNYHNKTIRIEVERNLIGIADEVGADGQATKLNAQSQTLGDSSYPYWWSWYHWPVWWHHANTFGRISWDLELKPGEAVELPYTWHYFWAQ